MSVATHLKIISTFDRWAHGHEPTGTLLHNALEFIKVGVVDAQALRLYHLNENGVQLGAATEDKTSTQTVTVLNDESTYRDALSYRQPAFDSGRMVWIAPLNSEVTTFGVMEVVVQGQPADDEEARRDWVMLLAEYVGQALDTRKLQDLARIQAQTSSELTHAATYSEIAAILAKNLLSDKQFLSVNLFDFDYNEQVTACRIVATANRKETFTAELHVETRLEDFGQHLSRVMEEARPFMVMDVMTHPTLGNNMKLWLTSHHVVSICIFPMQNQGKTFGFIALNSVAGPLYLSDAETSVYQSLVDQVSTLVRLGSVFEQADYTLAISERQKQAFNELVAGQDYAEMVSIIARHMLPEGGRYLSIVELIYDDQSSLSEWRILATANRNRNYKWTPEETPVSLQDVGAPFLNSIRNGEIFFGEDDGSQAIVNQIGKGLTEWLRQEKTRVYASFPITLNERPIALLLVLSRHERPFSRAEINAFSNIAGQMGVLVQVRSLLDQTRSARALVDNLVLANRLVMVAADYAYMAQSVTYTIARQMVGAAVTLFDQPLPNGQFPQYRRIVGMSSSDDIVPVDATAQHLDLPDNAMLNRLRAGQPVVIPDLVRDAGYLSTPVRALYSGTGANWIASFGLRSGDLLLGTLDVLSDKNYILTSDEIDAYTTLADQIGITIRSRQLNTQTEAAQAMAVRLVQTNLQISTAENFEEMALAVTRNLPEDIKATIIMLFNEPVTIEDRPLWIKTQVVATREGAVDPDITDYVTDDLSAAQSLGLQKLLKGEVVLVEDSRTFPFTIIHNAVAYMQQQGLYSFLAVSLNSGGLVAGFIALGAEDYTALNRLEHDTLLAIASQVAVAVENRVLVNQTADALGFVALQYEVSNALYRAQEPAKMLAALFQFVHDEYSHARLGIIDPSKDTARIIVDMDHSGDYTFVPRRTGALSTTPLTREILSGEPIIISDDGHSLTLPLKATDDHLIGVVQFINTQAPVELPPNRLRALRGLADQMSTGMQNRTLIQQMEDGLKETRNLYQAISALLAAEDIPQVLEVLYDLVAEDADYISLVSLGYDVVSADIISYRLEGYVTIEGAHQSRQELAEVIGLDYLRDFKASWGPQSNFIEFAETVDQMVISRPIVEYYKTMEPPLNVESNITIPIIEDGMMIQMVSISYTAQRVFDSATRRLFNAIRDQMTIVLQNQRLIRDTRVNAARLGSQVRVLQTLNQLAINLSSARDEKTLLDEACQAYYNALRLDHVGITMLNADGASATVISDYPSQNLDGLIIEDTNELQIKIRDSRVPIYLPDVANAPGLAEVSRQELSKIGIKTMLLIPLLDSSDKYLGAAGLEFYQQGREFTTEMIDIARTISAQVAVALQSIREVEKTQRQARQLQQLALFSQQLQTQLDVPAILDTLVKEASKILQLDHISVMLYDSTVDKLRLVLQYNNGQIFRVPNSGITISEGTTAGTAWSRREFIQVSDLRKTTELVHTFNSQMLSVISGPIFARGIPLGIVEVSSLTPYAYSDTDFIIFRQLVSLIGVAQENAETYTQSQRLARSKALVNEISNRIQQQNDLDSIMNVTVAELGRALGASKARMRLGQQPNDLHDESEQW